VLIGRSPVRISFGGGGTDLPSYYEEFGGAVLSVAINKYFYTVVGRRADGRVQVISSDLRVFENWRDVAAMSSRGSDLEIPLAVLKDLGCDLSVDLFLASEIPPGTGLGSSASVCVNILQVLTTCLGRPLSKYDLAERAFAITRRNLGRHVGKQDEYAAAFGGLNHISFYPDGSAKVDPLNIDPDILSELQANLMLFFTGAAHDSWEILAEQEKSVRARTGGSVEALHEIKQSAAKMKDALLGGDLKRFGSLLDETWQAKKRASPLASNERIDGLYDLARENGALGGKITGAGGGGFLLLYCEQGVQDAVRSALEREAVQEMTFAFDFQGAQVIVNDPFIDGEGRGGTRWTFQPVSAPAMAAAPVRAGRAEGLR
jgi:D-glycero-alpha-D-manno-heptose-7-phosphate kinase